MLMCVFAVNSCATKPTSKTPLELAIHRVIAESGWKKAEVYHAEELSNGNFLISISRVPARPGSHATAEITSWGQIIQWRPGL
jgi:hypothetical protein